MFELKYHAAPSFGCIWTMIHIVVPSGFQAIGFASILPDLLFHFLDYTIPEAVSYVQSLPYSTLYWRIHIKIVAKLRFIEKNPTQHLKESLLR